MDNDVFVQFGLMLVLAAGVATIMKLLRQPLIIGYIITGILVGPQILGVFQGSDTSELLSRFGIALLLFIIGIGLNPRVIRDVGRVALITGLGQVAIAGSLGFLLARTLDFTTQESFYLGFGLAFSSTIVALKVISDKRESNHLYAKIVTGFLLVQDIVATILLIVSSTSGHESGELLRASGFGVLLACSLALISIVVLPRLQRFVSGSQEYLFLFALAWGFGIASLFALAGLSIEVGALFAGVALAAQPYAQEVASRLRPLRDFFVMLFFIILGVELTIDQFDPTLLPIVGIFSLIVLVGNPLVIMLLMGLLGYTKKTSFKASLTIAQVSEFSLVFVILGASLGRVSQEIVTIITMVAIITIAVSTYLMLFDEKLFAWFERYLTLFERKKIKSEQKTVQNADVILFGYKKGGRELIPSFEKLKRSYLIVDYDPEVIDTLRQDKQPFAYGDANDAEFLREVDVENARLVISTIGDFQTNLFITSEARSLNAKAIIIVHGELPEQAMQLYEQGATYVMMPRYISSERVSHMISHSGLKKSDFETARDHHVRYVQRHLT